MDKRLKNWFVASLMSVLFTGMVSIEAGMIVFFGFIFMFEVVQLNNYLDSGYL